MGLNEHDEQNAGHVNCVVLCTTNIFHCFDVQVHRQSMVQVIKHRQCRRHVPFRQELMKIRDG